MDLKDSKLDAALARFGELKKQVETWESNIEAQVKEAAAEAAADAAPEEELIEEEDPVEFHINITEKPANCLKVSASGSTLKIHFIGKVLKTDKMFDSSFKTGSVPIKVELGDPENLQGWNEGLLGMCKGERRTLTVPSSMGYGKKRHGEVPPNSALKYFIELVELSGGVAAKESDKGTNAMKREEKGGFSKPAPETQEPEKKTEDEVPPPTPPKKKKSKKKKKKKKTKKSGFSKPEL
jgi:FKBP-type peptidyl-prolyl cis-trans isomerase